MTPPREWLKPPRSLLTILFLVTLVSVSTLGWFGWKLLDQERVVEAQRARERLEQAADRIAAIARGTLAGNRRTPGDMVDRSTTGRQTRRGAAAHRCKQPLRKVPYRDPGRRLLYRPSFGSQAEDFTNTFADGEVIEFQQKLPERAIEWYRRLAESKDSDIRAGALMRLARVLRKAGRKEEARAVYLQLASAGESGGMRISGVPAELIARHALCELSGLQTDAAGIEARPVARAMAIDPGTV